MTYEQLRVFQAVMSEGTFRSASKKLHKSQPAVSKMIQNLEEDLGIELLNREGYRPELTEVGKLFYEKSRLLIEQTVALKSLAQRLAKYEEPAVSIAINGVCPLPPVLAMLRSVQLEFPNTQLKLYTEHMAGAMARLYDNQAHLIISTQTDMDSRIMEACPYTTVQILPVAHVGHPLAATDSVKSPQQIKPHVQVIVSDSSQGPLSQSLDVMEDNRRWFVTDVAAKKDIIMASMGWGGLPEYLIADELARGELVPLKIDGFGIRHTHLYLIRRKDQAVGVVAQYIWDRLRDNCGDKG